MCHQNFNESLELMSSEPQCPLLADSSSSISVCGDFTAQKSRVSRRKKTILNCQIISFNVKIVVLLNVSQLLPIQNHGGSGSSFPHDVEATLLLCLDGHGSGHTFLQFQKQEVIHLQNVREKNVGILFFPVNCQWLGLCH